MAKLITVFGATGNQGASVINVLLATPGFKVRALTRNPDSPRAQSLQKKGCQVVQVDLDDVSNLEKAIDSSYGVFAVTNYWALFVEEVQKQNTNPADAAMEREIKQGKAIADVCKKLSVRHLVYSGLENARQYTGKPCQHFDGKAVVEKYIDEIKLSNTSTRLAFYYENFQSHFVQKGEDGQYSITLPMDGAMNAVSVNGFGPVVVTIFNDPDRYAGQKIGVTGDKLTMSEYVAIISNATGKTLTYNQVSYEAFAQFPVPGAADMASMFEYYSLHDPYSIELTRAMDPTTATFKEWVHKNKDKLLP